MTIKIHANTMTYTFQKRYKRLKSILLELHWLDPKKTIFVTH
jgi:hypothetical protein